MAPSSSATVQHTPGEDLPREGRVRRQAGEIEEEQARAQREITRAVRDLARSSRRSRSPAGARGSTGAVLGEEADFFFHATDGPLDHASFVAAPRGASEVRMRTLSDEERERFNRSDAKEWKSIIDSGAVEVLKGDAAERSAARLRSGSSTAAWCGAGSQAAGRTTPRYPSPAGV